MAVTPERLEPAAPRSRVKHSTTEPLGSLDVVIALVLYTIRWLLSDILGLVWKHLFFITCEVSGSQSHVHAPAAVHTEMNIRTTKIENKGEHN